MTSPVDPPPGDWLPPREGRVDASFAETYRGAFRDMVRLAFLLTGSRETAEDIVQEAFVKLHRRWRSIDQPEPYLRRAVVNSCNSHHRRRGRERRHLPEPARVVELHADEISDALARLPHRQRAALVLRFYNDLSEVDIAEVLGCRPGTVGSLIHRGLAELRKVIQP